MTAPADSSVPTNVLFIDYHFFVFFLIFFFLLLIIAIMEACQEYKNEDFFTFTIIYPKFN